MLEGSVYWGDFRMNYQAARNFADYWYVIQEVDGLWGASDIRAESADVPGQDGQRFGDDFYGPKVITISGEVRARNIRALRAGQVEMIRAFRSLSNRTLRYHIFGIGDLEIVCRKGAEIDMAEEQADSRPARPFVIELKAEDPRAYGSEWKEYVTEDLNFFQKRRLYGPDLLGDALARVYEADSPANVRTYDDLVAPALIVNAGTAASYPVSRLEGPMTDPVMYNLTTGQQIKWEGLSIPGGDFYLIDHRSGSIRFNGGIEDATGLNILESEFWALEPGDNEVVVSPDTFSAGAKFSLFWRDAYA